VRALETAALWLGGGLNLARSRLDAEQGKGLVDLVKRWDDLTDDERTRVEQLVGTAAGDPDTFQYRRARRRLEDGIAKAKADAKRLPQAETVLAAVFADETLIDDLRFRHRPDAITQDERGNKIPAGHCRVLEPGHVSTLYLVLHAIGANDGQPITIGANGEIGDDLPRVELRSVGHLRVNGWLTNRRDGERWRTGYGTKVRAAAKRWKIALPKPSTDTTT
jgi:hypothetical protein